MRPIFCGNFDYEARQYDLERLFKKYGKVDRVDMKSGFAFVYMEDERDAEDAIRGLDRKEFGRKGRRLRVEWTKQERGIRKPVSSRRSSANSRPSKTLFVINFDPHNTRTRDLERHFDPYGKILNVRIRKNFAFIQYESEEDATRALDATNMSKLMDRVISVEFAIKDDDERRNGYSPDRSRGGSPGRRGHDRGRSLSPYRKERSSPDYGNGCSPSPARRGRASPDYGRVPSPSRYRKERTNSDYGRGHSRSRSPRRDRPSPDHARQPSPRGKASPDYDRVPSPSRYRKERTNSDYGRGHSRSRSPQRDRPTPDLARQTSPRGKASPDYDQVPSPSRYRKERTNSDYGRGHSRSRSPQRDRPNPDHALEPSPRGRASPDYVRASPSPQRERISPDDYHHGPSPDDSNHELRDSPKYEGTESPAPERYQSRSPEKDLDLE